MCGESVTMGNGPWSPWLNLARTELRVQADDVRLSQKGSHVRGMNLKNCFDPPSIYGMFRSRVYVKLERVLWHGY